MKPWLKTVLIALAVLFVLFVCIPVPRFNPSFSTIVLSSDERLLGACIADDEQWRFPASNNYSDKYTGCLLEYEDNWFFLHPGVNPSSLIESARVNRKAGRIVRGGSTISMQVVRMSRNNPKRTYGEKILEIVLALRLELHYSKTTILNMYAANAPFGGNVVGIDAAAWRYFNTTPDKLTWAEAATLAVLPNSPSLVNVERGRAELKEKRNALLARMVDSKAFIPKNRRVPFTEDDYELSLEENIPDKPFAMPMSTYHYMHQLKAEHPGELIKTDIDYNLQQRVCEIVKTHHDANAANLFENYGVYVYDHVDDKVVAYVGNELTASNAASVDMVKAQHSTGSILKPFLYAASIDAGELLPNMILPDIPFSAGGYTPHNFSGTFCGAEHADVALARSLNAPFVYLLRDFGYKRFHMLLKQLHLSGIRYPADHYGLSIILGGAEASLYDVVNAYAHLADCYNGKEGLFSREAAAYAFTAMTNVNRPEGIGQHRRLAWKTGTSFGFRDAWAVGVSNRYVIGVWCGNASGEGRPGLIGLQAAAPLLFDVYYSLNDECSFAEPTNGTPVEVCVRSGYPKSEYCTDTRTIFMPDVEIQTGSCPYHKKVYFNSARTHRVMPSCHDADDIVSENVFVLPPVMEWFYKQQLVPYTELPPLLDECRSIDDDAMSFIYPETSVNIVIPKDISGRGQMIVFRIAHRDRNATVFWTINDDYLGQTQGNHEMPVSVAPGTYSLHCVDDSGRELVRRFTVEEK